MRRYRCLLAVAAATALAGCSAATSTSSQSVAPATSASASPSTAPKPAATSTNTSAGMYTTHAEAQYVKSLGYKYDAYGPVNLPQSVLDDGHDYCEAPPTVEAIIDNVHGEADDLKLYKAAIRYLCPKYIPNWKKAREGFPEGDHVINEDIKPGVYRTLDRKIKNCYWERTTKGGDTVANNFVTFASSGVTVTIAPTDGGFSSKNCGSWVRA